jgi:hypothetical protein
MIIYAERELSQPAVVSGYQCADQRVLRFYYTHRDVELPPLPYTVEQLQDTLGDPAVNLKPMPAGSSYTGYALFSGTGQWLLIVSQGATTPGSLRIDVAG